jgi:hypothetical protein
VVPRGDKGGHLGVKGPPGTQRSLRAWGVWGSFWIRAGVGAGRLGLGLGKVGRFWP